MNFHPTFQHQKVGTRPKKSWNPGDSSLDLFGDGEFTWPELKGWKRDLQRSGMRDEKGTLKSPGECLFFFQKKTAKNLECLTFLFSLPPWQSKKPPHPCWYFYKLGLPPHPVTLLHFPTFRLAAAVAAVSSPSETWWTHQRTTNVQIWWWQMNQWNSRFIGIPKHVSFHPSGDDCIPGPGRGIVPICSNTWIFLLCVKIVPFPQKTYQKAEILDLLSRSRYHTQKLVSIVLAV